MYKILILASAALAMTACGGPGNKKATQPEKEEKRMLSGGYSEPRPLTDEEAVLFKKVTEGLDGVEYTPQSVAKQIVAGTNYRFICKAVPVTRNPRPYEAIVVVYQPLPGQGEPRITEITRQ